MGIVGIVGSLCISPRIPSILSIPSLHRIKFFEFR